MKARRRLEAGLADRDPVALEVAQVLVQREREVVAVHDDDARIPAGELGGRDLGPGPSRERAQDALVALVLDVEEHSVEQLGIVDRDPVAARDAPKTRCRVADRGVLGRPIELLGHPLHEAVDDLARVGDRRREVGVHRAAGEATPGSGDDVALATACDRLVDRGRDVPSHPCGGRVQGEAPLPVGDDDRLLELGLERAADLRLRGGPAHPADVDARDLHPVGDRVATPVVVEVHGHGAQDEHGQRCGDEDEGAATHGRSTGGIVGGTFHSVQVASRVARTRARFACGPDHLAPSGCAPGRCGRHIRARSVRLTAWPLPPRP